MISPTPTPAMTLAAPLYCMVASPDGQTIATALEDKSVVVFSPGLKRTTSLPYEIVAMAISDTGVLLTADGYDTYSITGEEIYANCYAHRFPLCVAISSDGKKIAVGGNQGHYWVDRKVEAEFVRAQEGIVDKESVITAIALMRTGKMALATSKNDIHIKNSTGETLHTFCVGEEVISTNFFSPSGMLTVHCKKEDKRPQVHLFAPEDHSIVETTSCARDFIHFADSPPSPCSDRSTPTFREFKLLAVSPDGRLCVTATKYSLIVRTIEGETVWKEALKELPSDVLVTPTKVAWLIDKTHLFVKEIL